MVGGKVVGIIRKSDRTTLNVRDSHCTDECCVDVKEVRKDTGEDINIGIGDTVWWQGGMVMWSPRWVCSTDDPKGCGKRWDIAIPKVGYSHSMTHAHFEEPIV